MPLSIRSRTTPLGRWWFVLRISIRVRPPHSFLPPKQALTQPKQCYLCYGDHVIRECPQLPDVRLPADASKPVRALLESSTLSVATSESTLSVATSESMIRSLLAQSGFEGRTSLSAGFPLQISMPVMHRPLRFHHCVQPYTPTPSLFFF